MTEEKNLTEFNSNAAVLERVNRYLDEANEAYYVRDHEARRRKLECAKREVRVKMSENEIKEIDQMFDILKKEVKNFLDIKRSSKMSTEHLLQMSDDVEQKIDEAENELRDIYDSYGMGIREREDDQGL